MIDQEKLSRLLKAALEGSAADETELVVYGYTSSLTRFANSGIHQNVRENNNVIVARAAVGKRIGVSSTNLLEPAALASAVKRATEVAKQAPEQEDFPGFPDAPPAPGVDAYSERTAAMSPDLRADAVAKAADIAAADGLAVSGAYRVDAFSLAVANTSGTRQRYDGTDAYVSVFATDRDGISGSAIAYAVGIDDIDTDELARVATEKCKAAANPVAIDPGPIDVILEPRATAEIMEWLGFTAFGARTVQEGQSFMAGRLGEQVMGESVTIYDDGTESDGVPIPFDFEGVPKKRVTIIENGVAKGPVYDSLTAAKDGTESTGHAGLAVYRDGPSTSNLFIAPGESSLDDLLASVKRGLLVTSFHYVNGLLDTRKALFTGMTRDGTYLVENGKIARAVKNLRFTDSMMRAFSNVDGMTSDRQIAGRKWGGGGSVMAPTILLRDFRFTGATEF